MIGIYGIRNKLNEKIYVGQSINIKERFACHRYELNGNKHKNKHLQNAWNLYGSASFEFIIIKECLVDELDLFEEQIESAYEKTYNINKNFTSCRGEKNPFYGKKHKEQSKQKMSAWKKTNFIGSNNPNFGKHWTASQKLINSLNHPKTKLTKSDVLQIKELLLEGIQDAMIAKQFNVSRTVITRIASGDRWASITGGPIISSDRRTTRHKRPPHSQETKEKMRQTHLSRRK